MEALETEVEEVFNRDVVATRENKHKRKASKKKKVEIMVDHL